MAAALRAMSWVTAALLASSTARAFQGPLLLSRPPASPATGDTLRVNIRVDSALVLIPAHVTTSGGTSVTDLKRDNFQVSEDNVEQKITYFAKDDAPISIGVLLDTSGSMRNKMQRSSEAAATFFQTANPQDEFFLIEFNDRPKLTVPFTNDPDKLYRRVLHAHPFGRTSLLDAVHMASLQMKHARNSRKAILIVSDGGDNRSRFTPRQVQSDVLESDMQTYAIGIFEPDATRKLTTEEQHGPDLLEELAEATGGRHYRVDDIDQLASVAARVSTDLRNQYLLGYTPTNAGRDGKYRQVKVKVAASGTAKLRTYYRRGYFAPLE
ncbi:MAG: VWA domain-containing protein [Acidobacteriota bacterium]|nr:VWA domain-containing protein [Acidobacteriota bacterium]